MYKIELYSWFDWKVGLSRDGVNGNFVKDTNGMYLCNCNLNDDFLSISEQIKQISTDGTANYEGATIREWKATA